MSSQWKKEVCRNPECTKMTELKNCSRCKRAKYCSKECQRKDWKEHKPLCVPGEEVDSKTEEKDMEAVSAALEMLSEEAKKKVEEPGECLLLELEGLPVKGQTLKGRVRGVPWEEAKEVIKRKSTAKDMKEMEVLQKTRRSGFIHAVIVYNTMGIVNSYSLKLGTTL